SGIGTEQLIALLRGMEQAPRVLVLCQRQRPRDPVPCHGGRYRRLRARQRGAEAAGGHRRHSSRRSDGLSLSGDVRELDRGSLTHREKVLLEALSKGTTNKQLSGQLGITVNKVKFHLRNLFDKLDVSPCGQAIALYYDSGTKRC
ncbi:MAG: response regulator transcription factor, partial [Rhodospirillales bacterium]|nr:response regulator transcription factor [Rhodospirillales bacterium]